MWCAVIQFEDGSVHCVVGGHEDEQSAMDWAEEFIEGTEFKAHVTFSVDRVALKAAETQYLRSLKSA